MTISQEEAYKNLKSETMRALWSEKKPTYDELLGACVALTEQSAPQSVSSMEELQTLDPKTILGIWNENLDGGHIFVTAQELIEEGYRDGVVAVVVASADQHSACRNISKEKS